MPTEFKTPGLPTILTSKDWKKSKGRIAKMKGETGIGAQLDKIAKAHKAVKWEQINLSKQHIAWGQTSKPKWDKVVLGAVGEVQGNVVKLINEIRALSKLARTVEAKYKKSKTTPKSSRKHVGNVADAADELVKKGGVLEKNTILDAVSAMNDEYLAQINRQIGMFYTVLAKYYDSHKGTIAALRKNPTPGNFQAIGCMKYARDFTTGLGNIARAVEKGFQAKNAKAAGALFDKLKGWANASSVDAALKNGAKATKEEVLEEIDKLEKVGKAVGVYLQSVK